MLHAAIGAAVGTSWRMMHRRAGFPNGTMHFGEI
jgi:hypothetical protein